MNSHRFDALTRHLAAPFPRRGALRLLAGGVLGGLLAKRGGALVGAAQGDGLLDDVMRGDQPLFSCASQGLTDCGGVCADIYTDPYNCGGCGYTCGVGLSCLGAACVSPAPVGIEFGICSSRGLTDCGGVCVDTTTDAANCGSCGFDCGAGSGCSAGACSQLIGDLVVGGQQPLFNCAAQGLTDCGNLCADLGSDSVNCGFCGNACPPGSFCLGGVCTAG